jgi:NADPH:quinone reductase-like Zn-dependent oxidoreductase
LKKGDPVYGYPTFGGGWAEYVVVKEWEVAAKPKALSFVEAASVPVAAITAWQALVKAANLQPGQTVLIQIAKARGAKVIATASTKNQDLLKQLGADVAVDYTKAGFEEAAHDVDVVLDPVGGETLARSCKVVKKGGIILCLVGQPEPALLAPNQIRAIPIAGRGDTADLTAIAQLIDAGKIKPIVTEVRPLAEAVAAAAQAETHHTRGKVVLRIAHEPSGG